jgi:molybdenum cofactor cytidylyltransferase
MSCNISESTVIILAAGLSGRMGHTKALLRFNDDESFLEHIINVYAEADISQIIIVVNAESYEMIIRRDFQFLKQVSLVMNAEPEKGRLHSLQLGLKEADAAKYCFVQNVDQPFIDAAIIRSLAAKGGRESSVNPVFNDKGGHPVLLGPGILSFIMDCTDEQATLSELLQFHPLRRIDLHDERVCLNINTTLEYKKVFGREPEIV